MDDAGVAAQGCSCLEEREEFPAQYEVREVVLPHAIFVKVRIPVGYIFKAENGTPWFCEQDQTGSRTPPATKMAHGEGRGRLEEREEFPAEFEVREVVLP